MRMKISMRMMAIVACCLAVPAKAGQLWQNAVSGMSPAEVKKAYPAARDPTNADGKEVMLLSGVTIFGQKFDALFHFTSHRLTKVSLQASDAVDKGAFSTDPAVTFGLIRDELVRKYGQPVNARNSMGMQNVSFISSGTSIELANSDLSSISPGSPRFLSITYDSNAAGGENPL